MARILLFLILFVSFRDVNALNADSLKQTEKPAEEVKDALYYQQLAKREENPNAALDLSKKALSLRTPSLDENWVANVRVDIASSLLKTGNSKQAFSEYLTAENIYTKTGDISSRANVLVLMANFYKQNAAWKEAVNYYKSAQKLLESGKNFKASARVSLHLTDISLVHNDLASATENVSYSIRQYDTLNDKIGLGLSYIKLAEIYRRQKQYKKAETLILKSALPYLSSAGYRTGRIGCFDVLGKIYYSQRRYSEAKWFFIQANTQSRNLNNVEEIISSLINLGKVKVDINDYDLAKRDFKEAQSLASERNDLFLMAAVKDAYAILYKKTGNQRLSEDASAYSSELKDSLSHYLYANAESARTARAKPLPVLITEKKRPVTPLSDDYFIVKIIAAVLATFFIIFLILRGLKNTL